MMLGRDKRKRQEKEAAGPRQNSRGNQHTRQQEEEEDEEEEFPAGVECEEEYDEEDVYVMVQMPSAVQGEALFSSAVTVKVRGMRTSGSVSQRRLSTHDHTVRVCTSQSIRLLATSSSL